MSRRIQTQMVAWWVVVLLCASPVMAQSRRGMGSHRPPVRPERSEKAAKPNHANTAVDQFERMSPAERLAALDRLPPERRQKLQAQLDRYQQLSPDERQKLSEHYERFSNLSPQRQEAVRSALKRLSQAPPERQAVLKQQVQQLASMPEIERRNYLDGPAVQSRFSRDEQEILRDMTGVLPPE